MQPGVTEGGIVNLQLLLQGCKVKDIHHHASGTVAEPAFCAVVAQEHDLGGQARGVDY